MTDTSLRSLISFTGEFPDGTKFIAWREDGSLVLDVSGIQDSIAELGEQLAWLGAALRVPSKTNGVILSTPVATTTSCTPKLGSVKDSLSSPVVNIRFSLKSVQISDMSEAPDGTCWHFLFRSPVIVTGFPIRSRPENERGLELSLEIMSFLAGTPFATHFDNVLVLKGVSTMLVPTGRTENSIAWHFLQDKNGKRLPYYAFRTLRSRDLDTSQVNFDLLSTARIRNFVGWVPSVTRHLGRFSHLNK